MQPLDKTFTVYMTWIHSEIKYANAQLFEQSNRCSEFIQGIYNELSIVMPEIILEKGFEAPVLCPELALPSDSSSSSKRPFNISPSPTRSAQSPARKKPLTRPIVAPPLRRPFMEVTDNLASPKKSFKKQGSPDLSASFDNGSVVSIRGSRSSSRSTSRAASPIRASAHTSSRSPIRSPMKSPVHYPKIDGADSRQIPSAKSDVLDRLRMPTISSMQHAQRSPSARSTPLRKGTNICRAEQSSLQVRPSNDSGIIKPPTFKTAAKRPILGVAAQKQLPLSPSKSKAVNSGASLTPLLLAQGTSAIPRMVTTKIPSADQADTTTPTAFSTVTPFKYGLKKPLAPPKPSPSQITLPDISDNDSGASLLRSWAATPEMVRCLEAQINIDPMTLFGGSAAVDKEMDNIFKRPNAISRKRTSSAAWEHDGLTLKERTEFTVPKAKSEDQSTII